MKLVAGLVGTRFAGAFLGLATQIILTHLFVPEEVGAILLAMSIAGFASLFATAGYPALALIALPRYFRLGRSRIIAGFHAAALRDSTVLILLTTLAALAAWYFLPLDRAMRAAVAFGFLTTPSSSLIRYDSSIANSQRRFALSYVPDFIYRPGLLLLGILGAVLMGKELSVYEVLWLFVLVNIGVAIGQAIIIGKDGILPRYWPEARRRLTRVLRTRAAALFIVAAVATSFSDIVTLVAGLLLPAADVALVGVAVRLAAIASFVIQAAQQFVLPDLSAALAHRDEAQANGLLFRMNILTLAVIAAGLVSTAMLGKFVLGIFGEEYRAAYLILLLFMAGQAVRAVSGMNQHLLSMAGYQVRTAGACLTAFVILVCAALLLTRVFGLTGIGLAVILAELAWLLALAAQAHHLVGRRGDIFWLMTRRSGSG